MSKQKIVLLPQIQRILEEMGENIQLARLRRKLSAEQVAERAGMSRPTLSAIERGAPTVSLGHYLSVLQILGLEKDFLLIAKDDAFGRKLQDAEMKTPRKRVSKTNK
ncbi:MAG: helix-turn-helix transcriptional regulator [Spirochaetota bacterium]